MPAMKMSVAMPTPFQMSTPATVSSAMLGSVYQPGSGRLKKPRTVFTMPWNGSSRALKVKPTPIVDTSTGEEDNGAEIAATEDRTGKQKRQCEARARPSPQK